MSYNLELQHKIATLYYKDDLKQESIARRLKISRYKVSRILKRAKENGIIKVQVIKPNYEKREF